MMMKLSDVPVQPSNMVTSSLVVPDGVSSAMSLDGSPLRIKQKLHEPVSTHKKEKVKGPLGEGKMMKVICLQHANGSFKLVVVLKKKGQVLLKTGEEDEEIIFSHRAKLYGFESSTKEWREKGVGDIKILHQREKNTYRILWRR